MQYDGYSMYYPNGPLNTASDRAQMLLVVQHVSGRVARQQLSSDACSPTSCLLHVHLIHHISHRTTGEWRTCADLFCQTDIDADSCSHVAQHDEARSTIPNARCRLPSACVLSVMQRHPFSVPSTEGNVPSFRRRCLYTHSLFMIASFVFLLASPFVSY